MEEKKDTHDAYMRHWLVRVKSFLFFAAAVCLYSAATEIMFFGLDKVIVVD